MALAQSIAFNPFHQHHLVGESQIPRIVILPTPRYPLVSSFYTARSKPCSSLRTISCVAFDGDVSDDETKELNSLSTSISSLFVKGLADSVTEGRLRKVFSEFGEVSQVKIIIKESTRKSLGYGYVWFNRREDAELAVETMNGKGPSINHLLFADDTLFMCQATVQQSEVIKAILHTYEAATGQAINLQKSSIIFGKKILLEDKLAIKEILGIENEGGEGKYLGLPEVFKGSKVKLFSYIKDRLSNRLSGWVGRLLSQGGKKVLIQAALQALPVYAMGCFKLPLTICESLSSAISHFWWSSADQHRKIHWVSWDKICMPKDLGGLGFRDIRSFNQALLAKQAWRLIQEPDSLFARFFKSIYYPHSDFMEVEAANRSSFAWTGILFGRDLLTRGLQRRIGNGFSFRVWIDPWLQDGDYRIPIIKNFPYDLNLRVSDLIDHSQNRWRVDMLNDHFYPADVVRILKIDIAADCEDYWVWQHNRSGDYTVSSGYWLAAQNIKQELYLEARMEPSLNTLKSKVWSIKTEHKIQVFLWKMLSGALSVADTLSSRGLSVENRCWLCGMNDESINHILLMCPFSRQVWAQSDFPFPLSGFDPVSIYENFWLLSTAALNASLPKELTRSFPWILWNVWKARNKFMFQAIPPDVETVVKLSKDECLQWFLAQAEESSDFPADVIQGTKHWTKPPPLWYKCNVGLMFSKAQEHLGVSWILRDMTGLVVLHSRRSFWHQGSRLEAHLLSLTWAMESIAAHRLSKVIFEVECKDLVGPVHRPRAWPSFKHVSSSIFKAAQGIEEWRIALVPKSANKGAFLIAQSVLKYGLFQSYVASGTPVWLNDLLEAEKQSHD